MCVLGRIMSRPPAFDPFTCPNCEAFYQVVKVEAGSETDNREIVCRACGGLLTAREGKFVLKYFLLRKGIRSRREPSYPKTPTREATESPPIASRASGSTLGCPDPSRMAR
jgi:hypothetical protein